MHPASFNDQGVDITTTVDIRPFDSTQKANLVVFWPKIPQPKPCLEAIFKIWNYIL